MSHNFGVVRERDTIKLTKTTDHVMSTVEQYRSIISVFTFQLIHNRHDMDNFVLPTSPSSRDMNDQLLDPGCLGLHLFFIKILLYVECRV